MKIIQTNTVIENLKEWIRTEIPLLADKIAEENVDLLLPTYKDYKTGFIDVFKLNTYPTLVIGIGERKSGETFSNIYSIDLVSVNKSFDKSKTVEDGYLLSDALDYLIKNNPHLDGSVLDSNIQTVEYFQTDDMFISAISLLVEVEEGEI